MNLKQKIEQELKESLRNKEELKLSVLRMLSSAIHNREIEKRTKLSKNPEVQSLEKESELNDEEILAVIRSEAKKRRDSIVEFKKGGRRDLVEKESAELKILEEYLPKELGDEELEKIVGEVVAGMAGVTAKPFDKAQGRDFGRVMGEAMKKVKGQASGDRVSAVVKKLLSG